MAGKEQFVECPEEEYVWAYARPIEARQLRLGDNLQYLYLRRRDGEKTIKGPVNAVPERVGGLAVTITLLDEDLYAIMGEAYLGFMPAAIWNVRPGHQGIVFEHGVYRFETFNGILRPYSDGIEGTEFMDESKKPKFDPPKPPFVAQ